MTWEFTHRPGFLFGEIREPGGEQLAAMSATLPPSEDENAAAEHLARLHAGDADYSVTHEQ